MSLSYYNENNPLMAATLRVLIAEGHIAPGDVDDRSILDVAPRDLEGYAQCHFFAGIGVWSYALRCAGWPDSRPVWTGSCPCQPFSTAGKGLGFADERHLWPYWHWLIAQCQPDTIFGEQVSDKGGTAWLDLVSSDLEGIGYAFGALVSPAAGVGAPHVRHRTYFGSKRLADTDCGNAGQRGVIRGAQGAGLQSGAFPDGRGNPVRMADSDDAGSQGRIRVPERAGQQSLGANGVGDAGRPCPTNGFWRDADWLHGRDGKWRPVEPGTFPLVDGASARLGRLHGYGNAIVAPLATEFIKTWVEVSDKKETSLETRST